MMKEAAKLRRPSASGDKGYRRPRLRKSGPITTQRFRRSTWHTSQLKKTRCRREYEGPFLSQHKCNSATFDGPRFFKSGHCHFQNRPLGVETGQYLRALRRFVLAGEHV